jgi:hypothetical protein
MAISPNSSIDFAKIALEMRATVARWYNAEVIIVNPEFRAQYWDVFTNEFLGDSAQIIYQGKARVQPIRESRQQDIGIAQGALRGIRVQLPYDADIDFIQKGFEVRVIDGGEDKLLESLKFVVRSAINGSYGWNRTIDCDADAKSIDSENEPVDDGS